MTRTRGIELIRRNNSFQLPVPRNLVNMVVVAARLGWAEKKIGLVFGIAGLAARGVGGCFFALSADVSQEYGI